VKNKSKNQFMPLKQEVKQQFLNDFGAHLKKLRLQKMLTQSELANRCGGNADAKKIGCTERGEYDFRISSLIVLAKGLDVQVSRLFEFESKIDDFNDIWERNQSLVNPVGLTK
jgi:transcriptional regulator with XRE-family HTH domain